MLATPNLASFSQRTAHPNMEANMIKMNISVLVVDSKGSSRQLISTLLRECSYQVTLAKTSSEALQILLQASSESEPPYDLILKEHEPPAANACRFLRKLAKVEMLRRIPVVVTSTQDEREVVMNCLTLGAIDYLVKPLRQNELRHIWTRVWWWRRSLQQVACLLPIGQQLDSHPQHLHALNSGSFQASSSDSKETKCEQEEEPTSKEGSAPGNNAHGSNGNGSNGSKEGNGTSRVEAKPHGPCNGNGNGSSDNKNGNGNSALQNGHYGSNGNGASTTLAEKNNNALVNTAEGKITLPPSFEMPGSKTAARSGAFTQYTGPSSTSRKRPSSDAMPDTQGNSGQQTTDPARLRAAAHRERMQMRNSNNASSTPSWSDDTVLPSTRPSGPMQKANVMSTAQPLPQDSPLSAGTSGASTSAAAAANFAVAAAAGHLTSNLSNPLRQGWPQSGAPQMPMLAQGQHPVHGAQLPAAYQGLYSSHFGTPAQMLPQQLHMALYGSAPNGAPPNSTQPQHHGHNPSQHGGKDGLSVFYNPFTPEQLASLGVAGEAAMNAAAGAVRASQSQHPHAAPGEPSSMPLGVPSNLSQITLNQLIAYTAHLASGVPPAPLAPSHSHPLPPPHSTLPSSGSGGSGWNMFSASLAHLAPQSNAQLQAPTGSNPTRLQVPPPLCEGSMMSGGTNGTPGSRRPHAVALPPVAGEPQALRRRAAALDKYRKKRKNLKFSRAIRYESRKQLAQQRPRIKGQFVKYASGGELQDEVGGADAEGAGQNKGPYDRFWQEDEFDGLEDDDMETADDEDEEEETPEGARDVNVVGEVNVQEEEADVVQSLRELREAPRVFCHSADSPSPAGIMPTAAGNEHHGQSSLGSQSGHASRGSHGHTSHSRSLANALASGAGVERDGRQDHARERDREGGGSRGGSTGHRGTEGPGTGGSGNGKNGSDSGSNSPDENGRGAGGGGSKPSHNHAHTSNHR